uniref:Uncharacterized protein n=1 Tax=Trichuris muris TaxID=70415 RepID=A0A5S6Q9F0_TRIMR
MSANGDVSTTGQAFPVGAKRNRRPAVEPSPIGRNLLALPNWFFERRSGAPGATSGGTRPQDKAWSSAADWGAIARVRSQAMGKPVLRRRILGICPETPTAVRALSRSGICFPPDDNISFVVLLLRVSLRVYLALYFDAESEM